VSGPLAGIRVLEVGHMLAGPYCGMLLADLGADVIKIEPAEGDVARNVGPHSVGPHNLYFASLNRGKRSVRLDLASDAGRAALARLAGEAQALVTNLRPNAIRKLGLTYEALKTHNPKLVCVALTGYGLDGPDSDKPAYDYVIQGTTGLMAMTGEPGGAPVKTGYSVVDNSAGIMAAMGLLAKVVEGKGGQVDLAMRDCMLSQMNYLACAYLSAGEVPKRIADGGHPYIVPAQTFPTRDGHVILFVSHDRFWRAFAEAVGRTEWIDDPRFATMAARAANREAVIEAVSGVLVAGTTAHWVDLLSAVGVVVSGIDSLDAALDAASRGMIAAPADGIKSVGNPLKIAGYTPNYRPPPLLGEHDDELL
jgi:crotonobetainyl-CoA:carnitine CoA-transferase CaiB-like acyl-CoA transferase